MTFQTRRPELSEAFTKSAFHSGRSASARFPTCGAGSGFLAEKLDLHVQ